MHFLQDNCILSAIEVSAREACDSMQIISAYCKLSALAHIDALLPPTVKNKRLMVRFRLDDIVSGATDFSICDFCVTKGWRLFVRLDLHAKTFVFDRKRAIIGSANLTAKGIGLAESPNVEMAILTELEENALQKIDSLFSSSPMLDSALVAMMANQLGNVSQAKGDFKEWNEAITAELVSPASPLFVEDFTTNPPTDNITLADVAAFMKSKPYLWLIRVLEQHPCKAMYFGELTQELHKALVSDPPPFRKDVKELLVNLLSWVTALSLPELKVERPNYSQLIKLV